MDQLRPIWEIALGAGTLIATLMVHGVGMFYIQHINRDYRRMVPLHLRRELAFSFMILLMLCTHLVEVFLWAAALTWTGAIATFRDAYYYAAVTYTTLGYAENTLTSQWRRR